jgi:hypothetical protein
MILLVVYIQLLRPKCCRGTEIEISGKFGTSLWASAGADRVSRTGTTERTSSRIPRIETGERKLLPTKHFQGFLSSWSDESAGFRNSDN